MEAFYVCIIFLGIILVIVSLFFILMDRVNGKDFFNEFDRKKDEMFSLIQDSEEMLHELNKMSDYVVTVISEKNQEFFNKVNSLEKQKTDMDKEQYAVLNKSGEISEEPGAEIIKQHMLTEEVKPQDEESGDVTDSETDDKKVNLQFPNNAPMSSIDEAVDSGRSRLVLNNKRKEVLKMIEQGFNNDEIADKLKVGKGEIGLIRGLSK